MDILKHHFKLTGNVAVEVCTFTHSPTSPIYGVKPNKVPLKIMTRLNMVTNSIDTDKPRLCRPTETVVGSFYLLEIPGS